MRCPTLSELPDPPAGKSGWPWTEESEQLPDTVPDGRPWPKVTIVTPSYNQGQFIEETIRSVLLQGYPNLEYIIMDGGSTDNALEIIKKYEKWLTYWVSEPDKGQSDAINKGWKKATGMILAYLNSDDTYLPGAIITAENCFDRYPDISMIYGDCNIIDQDGETICPFPVEEFDMKRMLFTNIIPQQSVFFRKHVLEQLGYLDEDLHMVMDRDMWIRIALKFKVKHISTLLGNLRMHASNKSFAQKAKFLPERLKVVSKVCANADVPKDVRVLKRKACSYIYMKSGINYYWAGDLRKARHHLLKSLLIYPPRLLETHVMVALAKSYMGKHLTSLSKRLRKAQSAFLGGQSQGKR